MKNIIFSGRSLWVIVGGVTCLCVLPLLMMLAGCSSGYDQPSLAVNPVRSAVPQAPAVTVAEPVSRRRIYYYYDPQHRFANADGYVAAYEDVHEPLGRSALPQHLNRVAQSKQTPAAPMYDFGDREPAAVLPAGRVQNSQQPDSQGLAQQQAPLRVLAQKLTQPIDTQVAEMPEAAIAANDSAAVTAEQVAEDPLVTVVSSTSEVGGVQVEVPQTTSPVGVTIPAVAERAAAQSLLPADDNAVDELIAQMEASVRKRSDDVAGQLALRFLYKAAGQEGKAVEPLADVPLDKQAEALALARALILAGQADTEVDDDPETSNQAIEALDEFRAQLVDQAEPVVSALEICSKVDGFGRYEVLAESELATGKARTFVVYCELRNCKYQQDSMDRYFTRLTSEITLYDAKFAVVAHRKDAVTDVPCHKRRQDFFLRGPLAVPRLAPGKYQLEVVISDEVAEKIARPRRVTFEVTAPKE